MNVLALSLLPVVENLNYQDTRNISQTYQFLDIMYTAGEIEARPGLLDRSLWNPVLSENISWTKHDGISIPLGLNIIGSDLALRGVLPFRFAFKKHSLWAYEEVNLFTGPTSWPGLKPWDPRHDPRWEITSWDTQPIVGEEHLVEERQTRGYGGVLWDWGSLLVGRQVLRFGPAYRYAMTQSGFAGPVDFFYNLSLRSERLSLTAALARIPDTVDRRRITVQRVCFTPFDWLMLAATEGVYSARQDFAKYANPFLFFHDIQRHESDNQDNLFASTELSIRPVKGLRFYTEIFLDDPTFISGGEAAQYALMAGLHLAVPLENVVWSIRAEAAEASPYTYAHLSDTNAMQALGWPMAYWLGPDARSAFLSVDVIGSELGLGVWAEVWQHGQLWISDAFEDSMNIITDWPTGTVETGVQTGLRFALRHGLINAQISPGYYLGRNYQNVQGQSISEFRISGSLQVSSPGFFIGF